MSLSPNYPASRVWRPLRAALAPREIGLVLALVAIFLPAPDHRVERDTTPEIAHLQQTECEYRGITATFETLTQAYALKIFDQARLERWEARPNPRHPDTETLITGIFTAAGLNPSVGSVVPRTIAEARRHALPSFGVIWCLGTLGAFRITAHNIYAKDAIEVFRETIDEFIAQMVLVTAPVDLREGPGESYLAVEHIEAGTVLLREDQQEEWSYVRIPKTRTSGWLKEAHLVVLDHVR